MKENSSKQDDDNKNRGKDCVTVSNEERREAGAIVVVAKCPIAGKSKTRLIPLLGEEGTVRFAKAMLSDVLTTIDHCFRLDPVKKILLYAPSNEQGRVIMQRILNELGIKQQEQEQQNESGAATINSLPSSTTTPGWVLLPMISSSSMTSSNLGGILSNALERVRNKMSPPGSRPVLFLGMDAPELPMEEIMTALFHCQAENDSNHDPRHSNYATLCPAADGGYGMLCIPPTSPDRVTSDSCKAFENVLWSHPLTALSQTKALTDCNIPVRLGRMMYDIDEPDDIKALCQRILLSEQQQQQLDSSAKNHGQENNPSKNTSIDSKNHGEHNNNVLLQSSNSSINFLKEMIEQKNEMKGSISTLSCRYTKEVLKELGYLL